MSSHKHGSLEWLREYVIENTYWKTKRPIFPKKSEGGRIIWPFEKAYIKGLRLPGFWQEDQIEWYKESEYMMLVLKSKG